MTQPEEQESQLVEPGYDLPTDLPWFPQYSRDADAARYESDQEHRDSNNSIVDCAHPEPEQDSLASRIDETQFVLLEPETQTYDEFEPKPPRAQRPLEVVGAGPIVETSDSLPFGSNIQLPNDLGAADSFKWGKAIKPVSGQFSGRPPGRSVDLTTNSEATDTPNQALPIQAQLIVQSLPLQSKLLNEDHLPIEISKTTAVGNRRNDVGQSANFLKPFEPAIKHRKDGLHEHPNHSESMPATQTSILQSGPFLDQSSAANQNYLLLQPEQSSAPKLNARPSNKSHKRLGMSKQPFPEVEEPSRGRRMKGNMSVLSRNVEVSESRTHDLLHENNSFPNALPNRGACPSSRISVSDCDGNTGSYRQEPANVQGHRASLSPFTGNDLNEPQIAGQEISSYNDGQDVQVGGALSHPAAANQRDNHQGRLQMSVRHPQDDNMEGMPLKGNDESCVNAESSQLLQPLSRSSSQSHSRPQSTRSNVAKTITRPLKAKELHSQRDFGSSNFHSNNVTKAKKFKGYHTPVDHNIPSNAAAVDCGQTTTDAMAVCLSVRQEVDILERIAKERDVQQRILESQRQEISKLNGSAIEFQNQIQRLEGEKAALTAKINKLTEISSKYKTHMNGVVNAQKHLLVESSKIQKQSANVQAELKASLKEEVNREGHIRKLQRLIDEAKVFREPIEKLQELSKELEACKAQVDKLSRTNEILNADLQSRVAEIGRERYYVGQLRRGLNAQIAAHNESIETLKKTNTGLWDKLDKEDDLLAGVLNSKDTIQIRINELSDSINLLNNREQESTTALAKLMEDLYTRIENKLQATDNNNSAQTESSAKFLEDLKYQISQVRLDRDMKDRLNKSISDLREANSTLTSSLNSRELDHQGMTKQIEQLEEEITCCQGQLTAKSNELCALQRDGTTHRSKIDDLETANTVLQSRLHTISQEHSKTEEELRFSYETALSVREQAQEFQGKFTDAQSQIITLTEENRKYAAKSKAEIEKARQEVAKSAHTSQTEMKIHHDALVNNLEQRRSEVEAQLRVKQDELQKCNEENTNSNRHITNLQKELAASKDQLALQASLINHLDQQQPSRAEYERRECNLQRALEEVSELKLYFAAMQSEARQNLVDALGKQKVLEKNLAKVDVLEMEKRRLDEEKAMIQKRYDTLNTGVTHYLRQNGTLHDGDSVYEWAEGINMGLPFGPLQKLVDTQVPSLANSYLAPSSYSSDDEGASGLLHPDSNQSDSEMNTAGYTKIPATPEPFDRSPYHPAPKTLRAANRKPSNLVPLQMQLPRAETSTKSLLSTPALNITGSSTGTEGLSVQIPTDITPLLTTTTVGDSSPLSDIDQSIIDQLESYSNAEELESACESSKSVNNGDLIRGINDASGKSVQTFAADTIPGLKRVEASLGHQFASEDDRAFSKSKTQNIPRPVPSASEESARRRLLMPLKSALKKGAQGPASKTFNTVEKEHIGKASPANIAANVPIVLVPQKATLSHGIYNQQRPQTKNSNISSPYHRIASGSRSVDSNSRSGFPPAQHQQLGPNQASFNSEVSPLPPLMSAPQRNAKKRTASALLQAESRSAKPAKAPRLSRAPHIKRNVIPDSQELYRY